MNQSHIYHWFILHTYLTKLIGSHYPKEIIALIIAKNYKRIQIGCGPDNTTLIKEDIYVWGNNSFGKSGHGNDFGKKSPYKLILSEELNIKSISCGKCHIIILTEQNECYGWGYNVWSQLGSGLKYQESFPKKLDMIYTSDISDIILINCSEHRTIVTRKSNYSYIWGKDFFGTAYPGHGIYLPHVLSIHCGKRHAIALTSSSSTSNEVYIWGSNEKGQLGLGDYADRMSPSKLNLQDITSVNCGVFHTIVITVYGTLYSWGKNDYGQLGVGHNRNQNVPQLIDLQKFIISVSCGRSHTMALTKFGFVYSWGNNWKGQLGLGFWSNYTYYSPQMIVFHESFRSIHCGCRGDHTIAVTNRDTIYVWGSNSSGQLGLGDCNGRYSPTELKFKI